MPLNNASHPELIAKSAAVAEAFTQEMYEYLVSLIPTPQSYREKHTRLTESYTASLTDPEMAKECEAQSKLVNQEYSIIHTVAKAVTAKDPEAPSKLGLVTTPDKNTHAMVSLSEPRGFKVLYAPNGQLVASVTRVANAKGYQVWACEGDPNLEANWKLVASSSACRGIVVPGLNRGKSNWLRIRGMRGNVAGPWSNCVSLSPV